MSKSRRTAELSRKVMAAVTEDDGSVTEAIQDAHGSLIWRDGEIMLINPPSGRPDVEEGWTPDKVRRLLVDGMRLVQRSAGRVGPASFKTQMLPDTFYEWSDLLAQADAGSIYEGRNRITVGLTARQVSRMEAALTWPNRYVWDPDLRRKLYSYLACVVHRVPWSRECKRRGWAYATAKRHRSRALGMISVGLTRDGVEP